MEKNQQSNNISESCSYASCLCFLCVSNNQIGEKMDYLIQTLLTEPMAIVTFLIVIVSFIVSLIAKRVLTPAESALIAGISQKAVEIMVLIFKQCQYDHKKYNKEMLANPVELPDTVSVGEQKMKVAVQAMKEKLPIKDLYKVGDLFSFATMAYKTLKPLFKRK